MARKTTTPKNNNNGQNGKKEKKGVHTSTQATGPKRQSAEMSRRKSGGFTDEAGTEFGMWQG